MQINLFSMNIQNNYAPVKRQEPFMYLPLAPITCDTVTFGAMKKTQFEGVDYAVVQKFKAPIEKFNSNTDLQNWIGDKVSQLIKTDFCGRQNETKIQRKSMLKEWADYVLKENDAYNPAVALLILSSVTKYLKPDNDNLPPVLNKGVLADCISEIDKNTRVDKKYQFDLNKMYKTKLQALYMEDTNTGETGSKWVVIPSKKNDPGNFEANVEKLKTLSHKNWCTKSFNAKPYLAEGDFHVYLENGQPKLGVRFVGDEVQEIQGESNNNKIPIEYFAKMNEYIQKNDLQLRYNAKEEMLATEKLKAEIEKIQSDLKDAIENKDAKRIFEYFGIKAIEEPDGYLTISNYRTICDEYNWDEAGIDENWLLKKVKHVTGDADFSFTRANTPGSIETIGGTAAFAESQLTSLGNLKTITGSAYFNDSKIKDLANLESIGKNAYFMNSQVEDLGNLKYIGGNIYGADGLLLSEDVKKKLK